MKFPNLFLVGAPKCGTTSMAYYLSQHPSVFMSEPKEPHYFSTDMHGLTDIRTEDRYLSLFDSATDELYVGEASVWYLHSQDAIRNIMEYNPDARFVVMLRNPIDVVYSLFYQARQSADESLESFPTAWDAQEDRSLGYGIPTFSRVPKLLQYSQVALFGEQISRLFKQVDRDRVHIIFFDEFKSNPETEFASLCNFLGLTTPKGIDYSLQNPNQVPKHYFISLLTERTPRILIILAELFKRLTGVDKMGVLDRIRMFNVSEVAREPLNGEFYESLEKYFQSDDELLQTLIGRSLLKS